MKIKQKEEIFGYIYILLFALMAVGAIIKNDMLVFLVVFLIIILAAVYIIISLREMLKKGKGETHGEVSDM